MKKLFLIILNLQNKWDLVIQKSIFLNKCLELIIVNIYHKKKIEYIQNLFSNIIFQILDNLKKLELIQIEKNDKFHVNFILKICFQCIELLMIETEIDLDYNEFLNDLILRFMDIISDYTKEQKG